MGSTRIMVLVGAASALLSAEALADRKKPVKVAPGLQCDRVLAKPHGVSAKLLARCAEGSSSGVTRADFNGDGFADLAIGAVGERVNGAEFAGSVTVIYGSADGLVPLGIPGSVPAAQFFTQDSPGIPNIAEAFDRFGAAVLGGDFNDDGFAELVVGVPGEDFGTAASGRNRGGILVIRGSAAGLVTAPVAPQFLTVEARFAGGLSEAELEGMNIGSALAWGDFDGDGNGDLAVGAPGTMDQPVGLPPFFNGPFPDLGAVWILFGNPTTGGLSPGNRRVFRPTTSTTLNERLALGPPIRMGAALAAGDFNGDGFDDLAMGAPETSVDPVAVSNPFGRVAGGAVFLAFGSTGGISFPGFQGPNLLTQMLTQSVFRFPEGPEAGDRFGAALTAGDFDGDGRDDLVVGSPGETFRGCSNQLVSEAGQVEIFRGAASFPSGQSQVLNQAILFGCSTDPFGGSRPEGGDRFGSALAANDFNGDGRDDLAIGVPDEDVLVSRGSGVFETVVNAGEVDVIYGSGQGLSAVTLPRPQAWHQDVINVDGVAETNDRFGKALGAWNFGKGSQADLAIGASGDNVTFQPRPGQTQTAAGAGAVNVLYGRTTGLSAQNDQIITRATPGVPGNPVVNQGFGAAAY